MPKDPAFLFYYQDFIVGTAFMTNAETGAYIKTLCHLADKGVITDRQLYVICEQNADMTTAIIDKLDSDKEGEYYNKRLRGEVEKRKAYTESRRKSRQKSDDDSVRIYIVRDNIRGNHKIGSSVNPMRRYNELNNQQNPAIMQDKNPDERDLTLVWYSDPVLRTEEKILHEHFSHKNITGEWFNLNSSDLEYIFNQYNGTHKERTLVRTENEDENENININRIEIREEIFKSEVLKFKNHPAPMLNEFILYWTEPNKSGSKMRFELEKTWDLKRRLERWAANSPLKAPVSNKQPQEIRTGKPMTQKAILEYKEKYGKYPGQ